MTPLPGRLDIRRGRLAGGAGILHAAQPAFGQRQGGVYGAPPPAAGGPQPWSSSPPEAPAYPGQPNLYANAQGPADQGWKWLLFSVQGRINRQKFILTYLVVTVGFAVAIAMVAGIFGGALQNASDPSEAVPLLILFVLLYIPMIWIGVALSVKRWHDRDKSGWWVFIALIPIVGPIWAIVETLFLKGTEGPNRYGPDPLGNQLSDYAGQIG